MQFLRTSIQKRLESLAAAYLKKHQPKLIVVAGSIGKTSTKQAIAAVLREKYTVRMHEGNHNTHMSVPLAIMGIDYPDTIRSVRSWARVWREAQAKIKGPKEVEVIVQELGTDLPGDIAQFGRYMQADIAVVTAIAREHMEFFKTLEGVAQEELAVSAFATRTIVNADTVAAEFRQKYLKGTALTYGLDEKAEYRLQLSAARPTDSFASTLTTPKGHAIKAALQLVGNHNSLVAAAAGAVAEQLELSPQQIAQGLEKIRPVSGRMQLLAGVQQSLLLDDSYNATSLTAIAALQTLYSITASQRVAILGSINEMGDLTQEEHELVGRACDPAKLDWVVTVGDGAEKYLAPIAKAQGCQVKSFRTSPEAGEFVQTILEPKAVVLAKGSQNKVYTEEALKVLLKDKADRAKLVRQSSAWMRQKQAYFRQG